MVELTGCNVYIEFAQISLTVVREQMVHPVPSPSPTEARCMTNVRRRTTTGHGAACRTTTTTISDGVTVLVSVQCARVSLVYNFFFLKSI